MTVQFDLSRINRRALAEAASEILGVPFRYCGMPTANYEVGGLTITRTGELINNSNTGNEITDNLLEQLALLGFVGTTIDSGITESENINRLAIDIPLKNFNETVLENLKKIVASKETLIKTALGADNLRIDTTEDKLQFPWFTLTGTDGEIDAYLCLVTALCEMAKRQNVSLLKSAKS